MTQAEHDAFWSRKGCKPILSWPKEGWWRTQGTAFNWCDETSHDSVIDNMFKEWKVAVGYCGRRPYLPR